MSKQLKNNPSVASPQIRGKRLLDKLNDVISSLGDKADDLTLENLEASGMFNKEQAEALQDFTYRSLSSLVTQDKAFWIVEFGNIKAGGSMTKDASDRIEKHLQSILTLKLPGGVRDEK